MQSVNDMEITEQDFLTAEQMREITATPEELFESQVNSIKENAMTTMVRLATEQGRNFYAIQFIKSQDNKLVDAISAFFSENGYKTQQVDTSDEASGTPLTVLTISWGE